MAVDPVAGEMSLVGVIQSFTFRQWPSPPQRFTIDAGLYDGVGEGTMEVRITQLETEQDVYRYRKWASFSWRGRWSQLEVTPTRCIFPAPGRYSVTLRFDEEVLDSRVFEVFAD
jgi:hypothetical protein